MFDAKSTNGVAMSLFALQSSCCLDVVANVGLNSLKVVVLRKLCCSRCEEWFLGKSRKSSKPDALEFMIHVLYTMRLALQERTQKKWNPLLKISVSDRAPCPSELVNKVQCYLHCTTKDHDGQLSCRVGVRLFWMMYFLRSVHSFRSSFARCRSCLRSSSW